MKGVVMSDQQDLETLLPKLKAIPPSQVRYPDMPVEQAAKEGQVMATAAEEDAGAITAIGVAPELIAGLGVAVGAFRASQAKLTAAIGEVKEAGRQWMEEEPKAAELRSELLDALSYGLRNIPDAKKALKRIREGEGSLDMIKDIQALAELGSMNQNELKKMNYDAFIEKGSAGAKDLRDRAFTYMRRIMSEILDAAEYAFRKNPERLEYYYSAYRARQKSGPKTETPVTPAPATQPAK
jgi:hypothetical protein